MEIIQHDLNAGKICRRCGSWKPFSGYWQDRRESDGFKRWCIECYRTANPVPPYWYCRPENRKKWNAYVCAYRKQKPWVQKNSNKKWRKSHPEKFVNSWKRYQSLRRATPEIPKEQWQSLCEQYGNVCLCCHQLLPLTKDHIVPVSIGGSNTIDNIQPLCRECNARKGKQIIDYRSQSVLP